MDWWALAPLGVIPLAIACVFLDRWLERKGWWPA